MTNTTNEPTDGFGSDTPPDTPPADAEPKRRPGRPKGSKNRPKSETASGGDTPPKRGRKSADDKLTEALTGTLGTIGMGVLMFDNFDGQVIMRQAPTVAEALVEASKESPALRKTLDSITQASAFAAAGAAVGSMVMPILAHHGVVPAAFGLALCPRDLADQLVVPMPESEGNGDPTLWEREGPAGGFPRPVS